MNISNVVLILGKRLRNNRLTPEGVSRVEGLFKLLEQVNVQETAFVFCGGVTDGQTTSEAEAMYQQFLRLRPANKTLPPHILIESQSTNTIENIQNAADKLVESQLCSIGQRIDVTFVSNDYHLKRIFEIQSLMDEQGLLRVLHQRCAQSGLSLSIPLDISQHCAVEYPHLGEAGRAFLLADELTTYRVYLEGVKNRAFQRELAEVRALPWRFALDALEGLKAMHLDGDSMKAVEKIERAVEKTTPYVCCQALIEQLDILNTQLTWLNRHLDPERQHE
ncbi:YdcF family protein [Vibrio ouci]|uniref:YdcF family protein n=1 Tax=Vibrio ouci TaxID=2499078 RepID=A0A4Y8WI98_9VIBR|nr:YdcF family protein [Vibrio ouci]TFH92647.1 YdcF family protein [Vibrio ouci]